LGFVLGERYNRRRDIHDRFGGQEQGGIITPKRAPAVILITGESGNKYGYHDRYRADGIMEYYGEGQRGDMKFIRGNRAIRDHEATGNSLLLFERSSHDLRFAGRMRYTGYRIGQGHDVDGVMRDVIIFLLERDEI